jgi:cell division protein ZipA
MEDLRWILLLVGGLVIAAVYFSSRFEREDWVRERERFDARNKSAKTSAKTPAKKPAQKTARREPIIRQAPAAGQKIRKEPQMTSLEAGAGNINEADIPMKPAASVIEKEAAVVSLDVPPEAVSDSPKKSAPEPGLTSTSAVAEEVQVAPSAPVENQTEKQTDKPVEEVTVPVHDEAEKQEAVIADAVSEIPADVELTEDTVSELLDVNEGEDRRKENPDDEMEMPGMSISPGIEDEITGVEFPADLAIAEAELHAQSQQGESGESNPAKIDLPPNVEPLVLVLTIMAEDEPFAGPAVQEALEAEGLQHGDMRIFHCFSPDDKSTGAETADTDLDKVKNIENDYPVFSVASLVEPGYFELDKLDEMEMPGLTFFCQLPGPLPGEEAFNIMLDKGRGVAVRLHGVLCDEKRNKFTTQAKTHYQDRISSFARELAVARKKFDA